jgi:anti-sigma28 factor (negative regulator of flagellin synthesis)
LFAGALMRIENQNLNGAAGLQTGRTPETNPTDALTSTSSTRGTGSVSGDHAEISSLAENISQALSAQSVNRAQRIQELAQQYSAGTYRPSAQSISSAIVTDAIGGKDAAQ